MMYWIKLSLLTLLFSPFIGWAQIPDSIIAKQSENFFGSDCPHDTIIKNLGIDDACVLYSNEYKLCRIKKGRVKWTIDLSDVSDVYTLCMTIGPYKKSKRKNIYIVYYTGYWVEKGRKVIEFPSGKVLSTSVSKSP